MRLLLGLFATLSETFYVRNCLGLIRCRGEVCSCCLPWHWGGFLRLAFIGLCNFLPGGIRVCSKPHYLTVKSLKNTLTVGTIDSAATLWKQETKVAHHLIGRLTNLYLKLIYVAMKLALQKQLTFANYGIAKKFSTIYVDYSCETVLPWTQDLMDHISVLVCIRTLWMFQKMKYKMIGLICQPWRYSNSAQHN